MDIEVVKIQTPKGFLLDGMLFGSKEAKNIFVFVHGLGGNLFRHIDLAEKLVDKDNSVLLFNNRGNGIISTIYQLNEKSCQYKSHKIGMAHEVFADCVDDIAGAVQYVQKNEVQNIFLIGHSTGCQKSIYYLSKKQKTAVKGVLLLAPMSDFADTFAFTDRKIYNKAISFAQKMIRRGEGSSLLPEKIWPSTIDAQRFISLFTLDSVEEIFSYATNKNPKFLKSVKLPKMIVLAEKDEYREREISEIAIWFEENLIGNSATIKVIEAADHHFQNNIDEVSIEIKNWIKLLG